MLDDVDDFSRRNGLVSLQRGKIFDQLVVVSSLEGKKHIHDVIRMSNSERDNHIAQHSLELRFLAS